MQLLLSVLSLCLEMNKCSYFSHPELALNTVCGSNCYNPQILFRLKKKKTKELKSYQNH